MRSGKLTLLAASLMLAMLLGLTACKDEPATPPKGAGKQAGPAEKKKAAEPPAAEAEKTPAGEEGTGDAAGAEQAATKAGADATRAEQPEPTPEEKRAAEVEKKAAKVQLERTLRKVTAYGVTGPIVRLRDQVIGMLPAQAQEKARAQFEEGLAQIARDGKFTNLDWLDLSRGIGFAFEGKEKPLVALPITDAEAFKAALPEGVTEDENHGYALGESYALPYGKFLFLSDSFRTIDVMEGDLKLELTRLSTDKAFLLVLDGNSLKALVSSGLDEVERGMSETMPMQQEQKEFIAKFFNFIRELLGEVKTITVTADITDKDLLVRYVLETVEGSRLGQSMAALKPGAFENAGLLPAKSFFVMAQNMGPEAAQPFMSRYVDLVATAWRLEEAERADFAKLYGRLVAQFGPDAAFAIYSDSSFPLSMSSVTQVREGLQARDQIYSFYALVIQKAIQDLPPEQRQVFASGDIKQVVRSFAPVLKNLGVDVTIDTEEYRGGLVDYLVFTFDWDKLNLPPSAAWVRQVIRGRLGGAIGFTKEQMVFTFGPNPVVRAKEVMDRKPGLKLAELVGPEVEENRYVGLAALSFERLVNAVLEIGVVNEMVGQEPWVDALRKMKSLVITGGVEGSKGWMEARVGLKSILDAFNEPIMEALAAEEKTPAPDAPVAPVPEAGPAAQ